MIALDKLGSCDQDNRTENTYFWLFKKNFMGPCWINKIEEDHERRVKTGRFLLVSVTSEAMI